jgi:hypothetical protein
MVTSADLHNRYFADRHDGLSPVGGEDLVIATLAGDDPTTRLPVPPQSTSAL